MITYPKIVIQLLTNKNLSLSDSRQAFHSIFDGACSEIQAKNILLMLAKKRETAAEVAGCLTALQSLEEPLEHSFGSDLMDTCGTGGDGSHSLNISTLSAFVIAGAGGKVAKHGNRGISSSCGSSDLMEAFGVKLDASSDLMFDSIEKCGIGYFHAPYYHPVFSKMQPIRKKLRVRTVFNLLGPLVNPCQPSCQMIGVSKPEHLKLFADVLSHRKKISALICHARDGLDEISVSAPTDLLWIKNGKIRSDTFFPKKFGLKISPQKGIRGGDVDHNKTLSLELLQGTSRGALEDIVVANAGAGLAVSGATANIGEGIEAARTALRQGNALRALQTLIEQSNKI